MGLRRVCSEWVPVVLGRIACACFKRLAVSAATLSDFPDSEECKKEILQQAYNAVGPEFGRD